MNVEGPLVKAVPEAVRRRYTSQESARFEAVPEWVRSRAPLPPEETSLQQIATWLGPPTDPQAEVEEMEVEDANPPWHARERMLIVKMESYLQTSEELQVGVSELDICLLDPGDEDISVTSLTEDARDGGYSRFMLLDKASRQRSGQCRALLRCKEGDARRQGLGRSGEQEARRQDADGEGRKRTLGNHGKKTES